MIQDKELAKAVAAIPQRSEKQSNTQKLVEAFVDPGILPQIDNINSQIIYGRHGTGKTHLLRVYAGMR
jgi:ABC-type cobalamin/Fe3+-siderophores transport system ATPase subunit